MSAVAINKVYNAGLYIDGETMIGMASEVELPTITQKSAEHTALGMVGSTTHFAGFEGMEFSIKWSSVYADAIAAIGDPFGVKTLQLRGNIDVYQGATLVDQQPYVVFLQARFTELPAGSFKAHENVELETSGTANSMRIEIDGAEVVAYDPTASIYRLNGEDKLAQFRANIGQ